MTQSHSWTHFLIPKFTLMDDGAENVSELQLLMEKFIQPELFIHTGSLTRPDMEMNM